MNLPRDVAHLSTQELRDLTTALIAQLSAKEEQLTARDEELKFKQLKIDQLTHEMAVLKRWRFGRRSERLDPAQRSLLEESIDEDLEAISRELEVLRGKRTREERPKDKPRRTALPSHLPRREVRHEPESTVCSCGCQLERIGEDVSEKLDYTPGTFQVERHVRGKWVCRSCETLIQAPVPPQVIDKGIPTAGLLAHVLVSKFADHQPLYRLEGILERAEVRIPRSTLGQWSGACGVELSPLAQAMKTALLSRPVLHADETPVPMLKPGLGHTHQAYLWSYGTTQFDPMPLVVYDFAESRGGHHARAFLGAWSGKLVCDDFSGYKALFERGVAEIGCMAHYHEFAVIRSVREGYCRFSSLAMPNIVRKPARPIKNVPSTMRPTSGPPRTKYAAHSVSGICRYLAASATRAAHAIAPSQHVAPLNTSRMIGPNPKLRSVPRAGFNTSFARTNHRAMKIAPRLKQHARKRAELVRRQPPD